MQFDTAAELAALQAQTRRIRQVRYRPSRLDRYTGELLSLYQAGASAAELQRWLPALCRHSPELRAGPDPRRRMDERQPD
ncbi:hypothetical protein [Klebsiella pneumoniae]|uniref:hypothetical protein n=1 Tax=Klebsiella pneumoniae TaxID=573 RepID=UPI0011077E90|nr:hypothetical protein [Klebsiella pneumoniae]QCU89120.1 hypothetical protein FFY44_29145 [Klebsiella pneumoniae subsp. pneumoniae]